MESIDMLIPLLLASTNPGKLKEMTDLLSSVSLHYRISPESTLTSPESPTFHPDSPKSPFLPGRKSARQPAPNLFKLVTPAEIKLKLLVAEDGNSYSENAALKASAFCRASGLLTLADDSGLEVDALDGAPGLHSARYSPVPNASDRDRRFLLLQALHGLPRPWTARFRCTVALALPEKDFPVAGTLLADFKDSTRQDGYGQQKSPSAPSAEGDVRLFFTEGVCEGRIIPEERGTNGFGYDAIFLLPEQNLTMAELSDDQKNSLSHRARAVAAAMPLLKTILA
jgi:XTP/dITP diphosphohydrolase